MTSPINKVTSMLFLLLSFHTLQAEAKRPEYEIELKNHLFYPAELEIPENTKVKLIIYNRDQTPEEFDSFDLNREKVIFPNKRSVIFIGPLPIGRYDFFGEYNPNSARGTIIVVPSSENNAASIPSYTSEEFIAKQNSKQYLEIRYVD